MVGSSLAPGGATPLSGAATATVAWRFRGQLHVTVIAKATFAFAKDADMPRASPQRILAVEVHHGDTPSRSVRFSSDLAPYLGRADVLFTGYAHAPAPGPVQEMRARLAIFRREGAMVDKTILIRDPRGFQRLPIVYERAFGGPGVPENPLGLGETADTGEPVLLDPNSRWISIGMRGGRPVRWMSSSASVEGTTAMRSRQIGRSRSAETGQKRTG